ncbi:MAG: DUF2934 domain-containing protein [Nitrospirota bacterium]
MRRSINLTDVISKRDLSEEIAKVAYDLYEKRGKTNGHDFDDWIKAEKIVLERYKEIGKSESDDFVEHVQKKTAERKR